MTELQKQDVVKGIALQVMEHFYTVQGEGANSGSAAYFIRLAGCDVGCVWCDVKESWETEGHPIYSLDELMNFMKDIPGKNVVVTGGEPAMHVLTPLTDALSSNGFNRWIETSGAHEISGEWDWVCLSPKKFKKCLGSSYTKAHELKVVIANKHDFKWAETHADKVNDDCRLFLQPEWSRSQKLLPLIVEYVKDNPKWEISLQTHKYMDIP